MLSIMQLKKTLMDSLYFQHSNMEEEKDAFYVVRKGDIVGIYKNLRDCQTQAGSSVIILFLFFYFLFLLFYICAF